MSGQNWRLATLPDGRTVEYIDAKVVAVDGDEVTCDVTVLIDGHVAAPTRVTFTPRPPEDQP